MMKDRVSFKIDHLSQREFSPLFFFFFSLFFFEKSSCSLVIDFESKGILVLSRVLWHANHDLRVVNSYIGNGVV